MATTKVTTADFESVVLKSSTPVLVDFWASENSPIFNRIRQGGSFFENRF